MTRCEYKSNS